MFILTAKENVLCNFVEGAFPRLIFDKTVVIKQLNVVEAHGLLLFRADKGERAFLSSAFHLIYLTPQIRCNLQNKI